MLFHRLRMEDNSENALPQQVCLCIAASSYLKIYPEDFVLYFKEQLK